MAEKCLDSNPITYYSGNVTLCVKAFTYKKPLTLDRRKLTSFTGWPWMDDICAIIGRDEVQNTLTFQPQNGWPSAVWSGNGKNSYTVSADQANSRPPAREENSFEIWPYLPFDKMKTFSASGTASSKFFCDQPRSQLMIIWNFLCKLQ